jgi:hypothetical protein
VPAALGYSMALAIASYVSYWWLSLLRVFEGKLDAAAALVQEIDWISDATGGRRVSIPKLLLAACRGDQARASRLIDEGERDAIARVRVSCSPSASTLAPFCTTR